jgi:hypothetical protein
MNDLIDRYLGAVAALLPKASRQDIIAELRDLIMNRVEELESRLGRPLDKKEMEALLREIGHPIAVAGRYGPHRALVGPELYPFWLFGVKVLLAIAAIGAVIPAVILLVTGQGDVHTLPSMISGYIPIALSLVGFATLVAAAIERGWIKAGDFGQWKASDLPRLPQKGWADSKGWFVKSRFEGLFELAAMALFIAWWTGLAKFPAGSVILAGDGEVTVTWAPVLAALYWPILALAIVQVVSSLLLVAKPGWVRARAAAEIIGALGGLALAAALWPALPLVTFLAPDASPAGLANLQRTIDLSFQVILVVSVAISLTKIAVQGWRLARGK